MRHPKSISKMSLWVLFFLIFFTSPAWAVNVTIDPGDYQGNYSVNGTSFIRVIGIQDVDIPVGTTRIQIAHIGGFDIEVDASGDVTSQNPDAAVGGAGTLTFNNKDVQIDPGDYNGHQNFYRLVWSTGNLTGPQTIALVPEIPFSLEISADSGKHFLIDANGNTQPAGIGGPSDPSDSFTFSGNTITFKTTPINIDVADYSGSFHVSLASPLLTGSQTLSLVKGYRYAIDLGNRFEDSKHFEIDAVGNVVSSSEHNSRNSTDSFDLTGDTVTFKTAQIHIDPGAYSQSDHDYNLRGWRNGPLTITLLKDYYFTLRVGSEWRTGGADFRVHVTPDGNIADAPDCMPWGCWNADPNGPFDFNGSTLSFRTQEISIDPDGYSGRYTFSTQSGWAATSPTTNTLVKGTDFSVRIGCSGGAFFHLDADGNLQPMDFQGTDANDVLTLSGAHMAFNTANIHIEPVDHTQGYRLCGVHSDAITFQEPVDVDLVLGTDYNFSLPGFGGGVFSLENPCAVIPSETVTAGTDPNTVDFNVTCPNPIVDIDEDGVADTADNCPNVANADQLDQDNDGEGDLCDADLDGDTVENEVDNCPSLANVDQSDLDEDGIGDACDTDVDGDSVPDDQDNCPNVWNTGQEDGDFDGQGDACDADDDNDGVDDVDDNCPTIANEDQADDDGDDLGNVCDSDADGDGVFNEADLCPGTSLGEPVTLDGCSGIQFIELFCVKEDFPNHGRFVSCVAHTAKDLVDQGLISNNEKARFVNQAAKNK